MFPVLFRCLLILLLLARHNGAFIEHFALFIPHQTFILSIISCQTLNVIFYWQQSTKIQKNSKYIFVFILYFRKIICFFKFSVLTLTMLLLVRKIQRIVMNCRQKLWKKVRNRVATCTLTSDAHRHSSGCRAIYTWPPLVSSSVQLKSLVCLKRPLNRCKLFPTLGVFLAFFYSIFLNFNFWTLFGYWKRSEIRPSSWLRNNDRLGYHRIGETTSFVQHLCLPQHIADRHRSNEIPTPGRESKSFQLPSHTRLSYLCCWQGLGVDPVRGRAVLWCNLRADGTADPMVVHRACPIGDGMRKVGMNVWISEANQDRLWDNNKHRKKAFQNFKIVFNCVSRELFLFAKFSDTNDSHQRSNQSWIYDWQIVPNIQIDREFPIKHTMVVARGTRQYTRQ